MSDPRSIAPAQLARLSGLTERRLRELAAEGWFPRATGGQYQLVPAIQGLLRYYRERDQSRIILEVYDSLAACAAATGIPVPVLKQAKRQGCGGFRGSRVYLAPVLRWLFEPTDREPINYEQERAQQVVLQNARLKLDLQRINGELLPVQEVRAVGERLGSAIRRVVTQLHLAAPTLAGLPTPEIDTRLRDLEDEILRQLSMLRERMDQMEAAMNSSAEGTGEGTGDSAPGGDSSLRREPGAGEQNRQRSVVESGSDAG